MGYSLFICTAGQKMIIKRMSKNKNLKIQIQTQTQKVIDNIFLKILISTAFIFKN